MNLHSPRHLTLPSSGRTRTLCIIAALALALASSVLILRVTEAAFTREATLAFTVKSPEFDIVLIQHDDTVRSFGSDGLVLDLDSDTPFVPGSTARITLEVGNNSSAGAAALALTPDASGDLSDHLRLSAQAMRGDGSRIVLFGDPANPELGVVPGSVPPAASVQLAARGGTPLDDGAAWEGPDDSAATVTYFVHLVDDAELRQVTGASFALGLRLDSQST